MREADIQNSIRLELSKRGYFTERINVGGGYLINNTLKKRLHYALMKNGELELAKEIENLYPFKTGAVVGRSDVSAIKDGKITFLEIKNEVGKPSKEQLAFIETMKSIYGCRAGIARSVEDALRLVGEE